MMQSKPNASKCFYLAFNGFKANGPDIPDLLVTELGWSSLANRFDTNGDSIFFKIFSDWGAFLPYVNMPASQFGASDQKIIWEIVSQKYEIFDVNVTTSENIYNSYSESNRWVCVITEYPDPNLFNQLKNDRSETGPLPYSYRRMLLGMHGTPLSSMQEEKITPTQLIIYSTIDDSDNIKYKRGMTIIPEVLGFQLPYKQPCLVWRNPNAMYAKDANGNIDQATNDPPEDAYDIGFVAAHELGHLMGLDHDQEYGDPSDSDGGLSVYAGHNNWIQIMGYADPGSAVKTLSQWDRGDMTTNVNKQDDIRFIFNNLDFIKKPKKEMSTFSTLYYSNFLPFERDCWDKMLGYNLRIITQNDVKDNPNNQNEKIIEGMIGFPFDFDILKILLPPGEYDFEIDNTLKKGSMLDVDMNVLNCHCEESKENNDIKCDQDELPTIYPEDATTQCIPYNSCLPEDKYNQYQFSDYDDHFSPKTVYLTLNHTSIVYLRIKGGQEETPDTGWSSYGSVGKYELKIKKDGNNNPETFLPSEEIPKCHCQEFNICNEDQIEKVILYVQEEGDSIGTQDQTREHIKEYTAIVNGDSIKRKFLVYGEPKPKDYDPPTDDKNFYLTVLDPETNECKKQAFVVGNNWEKNRLS